MYYSLTWQIQYVIQILTNVRGAILVKILLFVIIPKAHIYVLARMVKYHLKLEIDVYVSTSFWL